MIRASSHSLGRRPRSVPVRGLVRQTECRFGVLESVGGTLRMTRSCLWAAETARSSPYISIACVKRQQRVRTNYGEANSSRVRREQIIAGQRAAVGKERDVNYQAD